VKLARAGCATCWSSHLLHTLCSLHLLDGGWRQQPLDWLLGRSWEAGVMQQTLAALFRARWRGPFPDDPRVAPARVVTMCQHAVWVYPVDPSVDFYSRATAPAHTWLCLPFTQLRNLAQLRIVCAHLEVEQGRKRRPKVPRPDRLC